MAYQTIMETPWEDSTGEFFYYWSFRYDPDARKAVIRGNKQPGDTEDVEYSDSYLIYGHPTKRAYNFTITYFDGTQKTMTQSGFAPDAYFVPAGMYSPDGDPFFKIVEFDFPKLLFATTITQEVDVDDGYEQRRLSGIYNPKRTTWDIYTSANLLNISAVRATALSVPLYGVYKAAVSFSKSGTARVYLKSGTMNTFAYISNGNISSVNTSTGVPIEGGGYVIIAQDANSGDGSGFNIEWEVTANQIYYIYVKEASPVVSSTTADTIKNITIEFSPPSWRLVTTTDHPVTLVGNTTITYSLNKMSVYLVKVRFSNSGKVKIYTRNADNLDTMGWVWAGNADSSSIDPDTGNPRQFGYQDDDSGDDSNYYIEFSADANVTYSIFTRLKEVFDTGEFEIVIIPPAAGGVHICTGDGTFKSGTVWVYYNGAWRKAIPKLYTTVNAKTQFYTCV